MIQGAAIERVTQERLLKVLTDDLGWTYLGNWQDRIGNAAIEEDLLLAHLTSAGYNQSIANKAVAELTKVANNSSQTLYDRNHDIYNKLRYGVSILPEQGEKTVRVHFIDWENPENNTFGVAEEVSVTSSDPSAHTKRPDIVLYVNGIALGVIELKRSTVSISEGIRQNLDNQKKTFIESFFTTMQLVMAGNDTEGLRYGTIQTPEKYYLRWKEQGAEEAQDLDSAVVHLCNKDRFLELIHNFVVFDAGTKKVCRPNQFFGVKAAQAYASEQRGGILWHTQGSGKSLSMVWLAKWIRENNPDSRILIVTDRDELDKQIEKVFAGVSEKMYRAKSGRDLVTKLNDTTPPLLCSLIHKFGSGTGEASSKDVEKYVSDLQSALPSDYKAKGNFFVFVDEAHRTQAGVLHRAMRELLPTATFIGFTGTPLLKADKASTLELFGPFIHQYRYDEAVRDGVVLDLHYEARDVPQRMTGQDKVDKWFDAKTSGLNDIAKAALKKKWGTFQKVRSSQPRLSVIVSDILLDMNTRPRLMDGHGNAILVASSIYEACRYYEMFSRTELKGRVAIVSSYSPDISDIKGEETGDGDTEAIEKYDTYRQMLAEWFNTTEEDALTKIAKFEDEAKKRFVEQPGQLKLLIVVDKLLTGFDAPSATYLYIDKPMQDHGLFQAICRVNRLDGDDKEYGYVIDYKDLFKSLEKAVSDYTSGAFDGYSPDDVAGILNDRLSRGKERLDDLLEQVRALCEPVREPKGVDQFVGYFVSKSDASADDRAGDERNRVTFYRLVSSLVTTYSDLASEMVDAGYTPSEATKIKTEIARYTDMREALKLASGDAPDLKAYEPGMRQLIDTYIKSDDSRKVSELEDLGFLDLFIKDPKGAVDSLPPVVTCSTRTVAATIENNIRKVIVDESPTNPKYYEKMSALLTELVKEMRNESISYEEYLAKVAELARKVKNPGGGSSYPLTVDTIWKQAIYDNFGHDEELAVKVDEVVVTQAQDGWQSSKPKRRLLGRQIQEAVSQTRGSLSDEELDQLLDLLAAQHGN